MKRYNAWLRPAGALVILLTVLALATLQTGQAVPTGAAPVLVTNTGASEAVPVSYPTTPTVNVGTLPSVTVGSLPSITGSVSISNTPFVKADQDGTWNVGINNSSTSPVLVRDVENPAHHTFVISTSCTVTSTIALGALCEATSSTSVPSSAVFVIETVGIRTLSNSGEVVRASLKVTTQGTAHSYHVPLQAVTFGANSEENSAVAPGVRLYADPATNLIIDVTFNPANSGDEVTVVASGYTVACGPATADNTCPLP